MKIINSKLIIIFAISILMFGFAGRVNADEMIATSSAQATESAKVEYELAYPGLLSDHPLYFLKATRDRITAFFISNPSKKAEFDLLQADKRVWASLFLVQKNEIDLAQSSFSKALNYFEDGLNRLTDAKSQGVNVTDLAKKMTTANSKHQEVLNDIKKKINDKNNKKFTSEQNRLMELEKRAKELSK